MAENALQTQLRNESGKGVARKLRAAGRIPGVCYGKGLESISVEVDPAELRRLLERGEAGVRVQHGGERAVVVAHLGVWEL